MAEAPVAEAEPASVSEVALVSEVSEVALVVAEAEASVAEAEASVAEAEASVVAEVSPVVPPDEEVSPVVAGASVRVRRRASKTIWCFWLKGSPVLSTRRTCWPWPPAWKVNSPSSAQPSWAD